MSKLDGFRIYSTAATQEDCRAKVEKAKRRGWSVNRPPRLITGKDSK